MYNLTDRQVVLGVTGSIAAYKAADLASKLTQAGAKVDVVMTEEATRFVTPLTFLGVTGRRAYVDMFDTETGAAELHVELARRADIVVVAVAGAGAGRGDGEPDRPGDAGAGGPLPGDGQPDV
jgi:phosphopantothenoylcysteine decarboxylase/phosphopantothenate--cysteine ligase